MRSIYDLKTSQWPYSVIELENPKLLKVNPIPLLELLKFPLEVLDSLFIPYEEGQQHGVEPKGEREVQHVGIRGLVLHEDGLDDCGKKESQPIAVIQSFESDCVLDYELSRFISFYLEIDLDADRGDNHKDGGEDLSCNTKMGQGLVPFKVRRICEKCFVFC